MNIERYRARRNPPCPLFLLYKRFFKRFIADIRLIDVFDNRGIEILFERAETMHGRGSGRVIISSACAGLIFRRLRCYQSGFERTFRGTVSGRIVRGTRHLAATRNFVLMRALGLK